MVLTPRVGVCTRSLFSLRRLKCRQFTFPARVSGFDRTGFDAACAESLVDDRLRIDGVADKRSRVPALSIEDKRDDRDRSGCQRRRTETYVEPPAALAATRVCAVEPDARRHELHHDRHTFRSLVLYHSARALFTDDGLRFRPTKVCFFAIDGSDRARRDRGPVDALSR